jgi:hypothetical protein
VAPAGRIANPLIAAGPRRSRIPKILISCHSYSSFPFVDDHVPDLIDFVLTTIRVPDRVPDLIDFRNKCSIIVTKRIRGADEYVG